MRCWLLALRVVLLVGLGFLSAPTSRADGEGPSVRTLVEALRYDPDSPAAMVVLDRLERRGAKGWKALASIALDQGDERPNLAERAAQLLATGREEARLAQAGRVYDHVTSDALRQILALGLARAYPLGADRLHAHLRRNAPGSLDLLRMMATRGIPGEELRAAATHDALRGLATSILEGRSPTASEVELMPRARQSARLGLDATATASFVAEFRPRPSVLLLKALAEVLREEDEEAALGAHCLLLSVSGVQLAPDAELWHSWIEGRKGKYVPPDPVSRGAVWAAVQRAVHHLRKDLLADGRCHHAFGHGSDSAMGATALAVLGLLAAGVRADDPAIVKAIESTLLVFDRGGRPGLKAFPSRWETYSLAILAMALNRLDRQRLRDAIVAIRDRLTNGVLENGQWTYTCPSSTTAKRPTSGDNSNTQYANLGLRALRASSMELPKGLWEKVDAHWRRTQHADGVWGYRTSGRDSRRGPVQMTASGVAGLSIAHEGANVALAPERIAEDESILKGLRWMGRSLILTDFHLLTPYTLYSIERACVLTRTRAFAGGGKSVDWYREGAWRFLKTQNADGSWGRTSIRHWESQGFGKAPSTAFALLFLTRATATIGDGVGEKIVAVSATPQEVQTPPPNRAPDANASPADSVAWQRPVEEALVRIHVESPVLATRTGKVEIRGRVTGPVTRFHVDDAEVHPDEQGSFVMQVEVAASGPVELVATGPRGERVAQTVRVRIDTSAPKLSLVGPPTRHVGKQRLLIESDEDLEGAKVGRHYFPADGRKVWVTTELGEHTRSVVVIAFDRAGNRTRQAFPVDVSNRVLVLDGKSSLRIALPEKPERFTIECWVRTPGVTKRRWVLTDAEYGGFGLLFQALEGAVPALFFHDGKESAYGHARKPVKKDRWTHLALTYDGAEARLWVNGKVAAKRAATAYKKSTRALLVGAEPDRHNRPHSPLTGAIDEVRFSDVCRYTATFKPAFSHASDRHTLVLLHFDTDTNKAILDASGRHHHATPVGSPVIAAEKR